MSALGVLLAVALAAALTIAIHSLHRRVRQRIEVASLRLFEASVRPRLRMLRLDQPGLLLCRIVLIALALALVLFTRQAGTATRLAGDVIAVLPGTAAAGWQPLLTQNQTVVWLDDALTDIEHAPGDAVGSVAARLTRVDQQMTDAASLTVVGFVPARDWPVQMPGFSRPIRLLPAETVVDDVPEVLPQTIMMVALDGDQRQRLDGAIALWRSAGVLREDVSVRDITTMPASLPAGAVWVIAGGDKPTPPMSHKDQAIVRLGHTPADGESPTTPRVSLDAWPDDGALATALWHALSRQPGARPVAGASLAAGTLDNRVTIGGSMLAPDASRERAPSGALLTLLLVFALERWLSVRAVAP